jgi:hypothetical protein
MINAYGLKMDTLALYMYSSTVLYRQHIQLKAQASSMSSLHANSASMFMKREHRFGHFDGWIGMLEP